MALLDLIEIVPLDKPVRAEITVPGSKSITNRALILAALADGEVTLTGALWSEDTQIMVECLQKLGFEICVGNDPDEFCNRTIKVKGLGGKILPQCGSGTAEKPLELFVGNAGTAARFLSAFVCLGNGVYRLSGVPRMHERPQAALFQALRELGYRVESEKGNDKLPVKIFGAERGCVGNQPQQIGTAAADASRTAALRSCKVSIEESSQFASALLLCAKVGGWEIEVVGENAEESPYVAMTSKLIAEFLKPIRWFRIEPDTSSGSYFWGAGWMFPIQKNLLDLQNNPIRTVGEFARILSAYERNEPLPPQTVLSVIVRNWPNSRWQIDQDFPSLLYLFPNSFHIISRETHLGDSIMTAIALSPMLSKVSKFQMLRWFRIPFFPKTKKFEELGRLRLQETERVVALRTELTKCGAKVVEEGDTLTVYPSQLHGAEIKTYNDHRMAMCFAILGLKVPGIKIKNPACVKKTFPNFFQKLAASPPNGLGATILDAKTGRKLTHEELFAD